MQPIIKDLDDWIIKQRECVLRFSYYKYKHIYNINKYMFRKN